ncbi:MAG: ribonuclease Z [Anaerolineaceae bacterium]|nr:ribonuclease Z [Anaerolineaceae bacterium]
MFEIIFLGTSASAPSVKRGLSAQVILHDEYRFLIDCGEGTQRQILQAGIGFKRLNKILITHGHLDHILGLAGLLSTFMRWEAIDRMEIYGGKAALERIHDLLYGVVLRGGKPPMPIDLKVISQGIFFEADDFRISTFPVFHRAPDSLGYLFEEKSRRPFLPELAAALAIPPGPWRKDLVEGKRITLPDGRVITPDMVLGEVRQGTRLAYIGDVGHVDSLVDVVKDVDCLAIEATYLEEERDMARQFAHLTARQAAELAKKAGVKQLVLTHISRRYRDKDVLQEAQAIFPNTIVARDFDVVSVKREQDEITK